MNSYSSKAILNLLERLEVRHYEIDGDSVILINYYGEGKLFEIELPPSEVYISLGKGKRITSRDGKPINSMVEDLMDLIYEVEFNKVPLYMGRLPEIAAWRLEMGE
jgi:hypothetical protein